MIFFWILFIVLFLLILWMYLGYPITLWFISKVSNKAHQQSEYFPMVSVIVCTYNESITIGRRIQNLVESDYPKQNIEIIIVDSNSPDNTADIVEILIPQFPDNNIKLIKEEERRGKVSAINQGLLYAKGEIIILTDGPTLFWKDTIKYILQNFVDPKVGAATGNFIRNISDGTTAAQETEWIVFNFRKVLRRLESAVDSTTWLSGELTAFRKSIISQLPPDVIIDDSHIALSVREKGYRVVVDERARYSEKRPTIFSETVTNKIKCVAPGIRETVRFRKMMFNHKYKYYGLLTYPTRIMYVYLNPFLFMGVFLCMIIILISYFDLMTISAVSIIILGVIVIGSIYKQGKLIRPLVAFFLMQYIILAGLLQYARGSYSSNWKQVTTTRS